MRNCVKSFMIFGLCGFGTYIAEARQRLQVADSSRSCSSVSRAGIQTFLPLMTSSGLGKLVWWGVISAGASSSLGYWSAAAIFTFTIGTISHWTYTCLGDVRPGDYLAPGAESERDVINRLIANVPPYVTIDPAAWHAEEGRHAHNYGATEIAVDFRTGDDTDVETRSHSPSVV